MVDRAAKNAAKNTKDTISSVIPLDLHEYRSQIKRISQEHNLHKLTLIDRDYSRNCIKYKDVINPNKILK